MRTQFARAIVLLSVCMRLAAAASTAPVDPLNRLNPRSAVTSFLEACHQNDYVKAAQYLNLSAVPVKQRTQQGPALARDLESVLNSDEGFDVLQLSQDPQGNLNDDADPNVEHVTTVTSKGVKFPIDLQRSQPPNAPAVWLFPPATVAELPKIVPIPSTESVIEAHLPRFLVATQVLDTALWKWLALLLLALIFAGGSRVFLRIINRGLRAVPARFQREVSFAWIRAVVDPFLVLLCVVLFRLLEELVAPSALTRLYVGRALLLVVVWAFAWGLINLLDYLIVRLDHTLNSRQRVVSRSVIYLGRRTLKTTIAVLAGIVILDNWGFNMTTIIAGLGVGGIAVALAAQQTIANVFGGVSVIGDSPVMVGDFGNFGGVTGTVEDIGLRSARVRTLNRTVVSIPNSSFAGMNLENFALRDKMLFNPTFQVKRASSKEQIQSLMKALHDMLQANKNVEIGPSPIRISGYSAASFAIEVFAYVLTDNIDEFYKHQADLYLAINDVVNSSGVELV